MSVGLGLIHKILTERRPLSELTEQGIGIEQLEGEERQALEMVRRHTEAHGELPRVETVEVETGVSFPDFPDEPFGYWVDRVERRVQSSLILDASNAMQESVSDGELHDARQAARRLVIALEVRSPTEQMYQMAVVAPDVLSAHDARQRAADLSGIPFGIEYLDNVSDGAQPSDTIALVGRPGAGKTYFMLKLSLSAHDMSRTPLFVSLEMSPLQLVRRLVALRSSVPASLMRLGRLSPWGRNLLVQNISSLQALANRPFHLMQGGLNMTVEDLVLRVQEIRPSALYVDGAYLLRSKRHQASRWERVTETAEVLKMIAIEFQIPVIASYQFNRRGPGSIGNIAFSDAVGQLASIVIGIDEEQHQSPLELRLGRYIKILELLKGREGERGRLRVMYDMMRMRIHQIEVLDGFTQSREE